MISVEIYDTQFHLKYNAKLLHSETHFIQTNFNFLFWFSAGCF